MAGAAHGDAELVDESQIRRFIRGARPDWSAPNLDAVEAKLRKIDIDDVPTMVMALKVNGNAGLNELLREAGEKGFAAETLTALRRQQQLPLPAPQRRPRDIPQGQAPAALQGTQTPKGQDLRGSVALEMELVEEPQIRRFLRGACPGWPSPRLDALESSLRKIDIDDRATLVMALKLNGDDGLNEQLRDAGEEDLAAETLGALRRQQDRPLPAPQNVRRPREVAPVPPPRAAPRPGTAQAQGEGAGQVEEHDDTPMGLACLAGHFLARIFTDHDRFGCDDCGSRQPTGSVMFSCRQCNFDICSKCAEATAQLAPSEPRTSESKARLLPLPAPEADQPPDLSAAAQPSAPPRPRPAALPRPPVPLVARRFQVTRFDAVVYEEPTLDSPAVGIRKIGEHLSTEEETFDGWAKLAGGPGWVQRCSCRQGIVELFLKPAEQLSPLATWDVSEKPGPRRFEVVFGPRVIVRAAPSRTGKQKDSKRLGDPVLAESQTYDGWVRLENSAGWMLSFSSTEGPLLLAEDESWRMQRALGHQALLYSHSKIGGESKGIQEEVMERLRKEALGEDPERIKGCVRCARSFGIAGDEVKAAELRAEQLRRGWKKQPGGAGPAGPDSEAVPAVAAESISGVHQKSNEADQHNIQASALDDLASAAARGNSAEIRAAKEAAKAAGVPKREIVRVYALHSSK